MKLYRVYDIVKETEKAYGIAVGSNRVTEAKINIKWIAKSVTKEINGSLYAPQWALKEINWHKDLEYTLVKENEEIASSALNRVIDIIKAEGKKTIQIFTEEKTIEIYVADKEIKQRLTDKEIDTVIDYLKANNIKYRKFDY